MTTCTQKTKVACELGSEHDDDDVAYIDFGDDTVMRGQCVLLRLPHRAALREARDFDCMWSLVGIPAGAYSWRAFRLGSLPAVSKLAAFLSWSIGVGGWPSPNVLRKPRPRSLMPVCWTCSPQHHAA